MTGWAVRLAGLAVSAVAHEVVVVLAVRIPAQILDAVVVGNPVAVARNKPLWARSHERFEDQDVH